MSTRKTKLLCLLATIAFVMACGPAIATPFPTANPNELNTVIALTANAASTQTVAALPTATFTPTITPTRPTETPAPSATSTVIFILSSPTKVVVPTFTPISSSGGGSSSGGSGGSSSSSNFACQVISVSPANGTDFKPRADFDTTWRVKNIGQKNWDRNSVDFVYDSGAKINKVSGYDLSNNVKVGEQIDLSADMESPKNSGTYTTTWTLRVGDSEF